MQCIFMYCSVLPFFSPNLCGKLTGPLAFFRICDVFIVFITCPVHVLAFYRLLQLCQRTMALPVGRGLFTLFSYHPVPTEPLPVPKLNLTGILSLQLKNEIYWNKLKRMWKFVNGSFNRNIKLVCAIIKAVAVQFITALEET